MPSQGTLNCEKLCDFFEGREAIYIEGGILRVRVTSIRCNVDGRQIDANVEEIPTKGLERSLFHLRRPNEPTPLRWNIGAGYLTTFSDETWELGYGGWLLFFAPEVVSGFLSLASDWPAELDAVERYNRAVRFLRDQHACKPSKPVFPE